MRKSLIVFSIFSIGGRFRVCGADGSHQSTGKRSYRNSWAGALFDGSSEHGFAKNQLLFIRGERIEKVRGGFPL